MPRFGRGIRVALIGAVLLSGILAGAVIAAGIKQNGGAVSAVYTVNSTATAATSSPLWADMLDMKTTVHVPSGQHATLVITFTAESKCTAEDVNESCFVIALVDGGAARPYDVYFDSPSHKMMETRSMQWTGFVTAGDHVVKLQFSASANPNQAGFQLGARELTVLRSKA